MWETGRLTGLLAGRRGRVAEFNPTPSSCSGAVGDRPGSRAGWQAGWQVRSGQDRPGEQRVRSDQGRAVPDRIGQGRAGQGRAGQGRTVCTYTTVCAVGVQSVLSVGMNNGICR